jgi:F-type H+-transporting ATPase subunit a
LALVSSKTWSFWSLLSVLGKDLLLSQFVHLPPNLAGVKFVSDVHVDTLVLSWTCMAGILATAVAIRPMLMSDGPGGKVQAIAEGLYSFLEDIARAQIGPRYRTFFPLVAAIFIFVLCGNILGIGPWKVLEHVPGWFHLTGGEAYEIASPTTDFNVTAGLALIALLTYMGAGAVVHGWKYVKELVTNPVEWLDFVIRPSTLALRLMLVITADEIVRMVFLLMLPTLAPVAVMAFEVFIAVIQAFVFALLTSIYIGLAVREEH